jgi:hypothetical protein
MERYVGSRESDVDASRQRRVRDAAIAAEHKNYGDNVRRVMEQAAQRSRWRSGRCPLFRAGGDAATGADLQDA